MATTAPPAAAPRYAPFSPELAAEHRQDRNSLGGRARRVLLVVANPSTNPALGWPLGFWAAELTHPWLAFTEAGYDVTIASPDGGKVVVDALSDPRDPSGWSAEDLVSMGWLSTPRLAALLDDTPALGAVDWAGYDALVVAGGQSPMFTFRDHAALKRAIREFYEGGRVVAVYCHGTAALVDCTLSDGSYLVAGKTVTGFANVEEDYSDAYVGQTVMPWRLEDALRARGANYVQGGRFRSFTVRDGRLITGQQHYSGRAVAEQVIAALGR